jgi:hypothetical protein
MIKVFGDYMDKFLKVFVDDFNIHNMTWKDNLNHLQFVLLKLRLMNLKLNLSKCEFAKTNIGFLYHVVKHGWNIAWLTKDQSNYRISYTYYCCQCQSLFQFHLTLLWYYHNYVKGYSRIATPLFEFIKKDKMFVWMPLDVKMQLTCWRMHWLRRLF